jgi:hypothetical protein
MKGFIRGLLQYAGNKILEIFSNLREPMTYSALILVSGLSGSSGF